MSWLRIIPRAPVARGPQQIRSISSSSSKHNNLLAVLSDSSVAQPPSNAVKGAELTKIAHELLVSDRTDIGESERRVNYQRQIHRKWRLGDIYAPHDLSGAEQRKWKLSRKKPSQDAFDVLGINPIREYKNFTMMSEFMTEMGRIKHSKDTGLRPKNQRRIAKAIRRAVGLGLMPSVHRHPLVLRKAGQARFA